MKIYNVEEGELLAITALDLSGSVLLSVTVSLVFFYFGANWDLLIAAGLDEPVLAEARATRSAAGAAAIAGAVLTLAVVAARFIVTNHIKKTSKLVSVS